jgi:hypothetical protein
MSDVTDQPIDRCLERWHAALRGELPGGLDDVLHQDCVFVSPIVFTPQRGREITKLYLAAAGGTLGGKEPSTGDQPGALVGGAFRYAREIRQGHDAMLEFESDVDGTYVNGVDIIHCDDDGLITEFKVMVRPLKAINLLHEQMRAALERLQSQ